MDRIEANCRAGKDFRVGVLQPRLPPALASFCSARAVGGRSPQCLDLDELPEGAPSPPTGS